MFRSIVCIALSLTLGSVAAVAQDDELEAEVHTAYDFTMTDIDGQDLPLSQFAGDVLLVVNVASECGLTRQYTGLEQLHDRYNEQGLRVLGFPCNQFGGQEPGDEAAIKSFCQSNYDVSFAMFSKVEVNGEGRCDLYEHLTSQQTQPAEAGDITWNFEKFLIDRHGKVIGRFSPRVKPDDPELIKAIESALAEKRPEPAADKE